MGEAMFKRYLITKLIEGSGRTTRIFAGETKFNINNTLFSVKSQKFY